MTDRRTRQAVLDTLEVLARTGADTSHVGAVVERGVVTLMGHVASHTVKGAVERTVLRVPGVRALAEQLVVRPPACSLTGDERLAECIVGLLSDAGVAEGDVTVKVEAGCVTLEGCVPRNETKALLSERIGGLNGVRSVVECLGVGSPARAAEIKAAILEVLDRDPSDPDTILVGVEGDKVILAGWVQAWGERELAEHAAWSTPGVHSVDDKLRLGR